MEKQNIKYTPDGKKVVILGDLNDTEKIVQEIFVTDGGKEFPGGQNFTATSLLDEPAKPWKQKALEELEERYETDRREWDRKISFQNKEYKETSDLLGNMLKQMKSLSRSMKESDFETLVNFISGKITHLAINRYGSWSVIEFDKGLQYKDSWDHDLKLVSVYGKSNGDLGYRLGQYTDGSGGCYYEVKPFSNYDDARQYVINQVIASIDERGLNDYHLKAAEQLKFDLPADAVRALYEKQIEQYQKNIEALDQSKAKDQQNLNDLKAKLTNGI